MSAPIAVSYHVRNRSSLAGSAFAPWSTYIQPQEFLGPQAPVQPSCDPSRIQVSPPSFTFLKMASPPSLSHVHSYLPESTGLYDTAVFEQEHCTGYECCNVQLRDMHAVMDHYEQAHSVTSFGSSRVPPQQVPVSRPSELLAPPPMPVVIPQPYDSDFSSAPSPVSTSSERGRSLSIPDEEVEFDIELDARMPQTPPSVVQQSQNVAIVGAGDLTSPDGCTGFQHHQAGYENASPFNGNQYMHTKHQQHQYPQTSGMVYPTVRVPQLPVVPQQSFPSPHRPDDIPPPLMQSHYPQGPGPLEMESQPLAHDGDVLQEQDGHYKPPSFANQRQLSRPYLSPRSSLHVKPTRPPVYAPTRSHSFHEASQSPSYNAHPVQTHAETFAAPRPIAHGAAPAFTRQQLESHSVEHSPRQTPVSAIRRNGSMPFPSAPVPSPSPYTARKRSYDEVNPSCTADEGEDTYEEDDDDDAEGELEIPALGPAIVMQSQHAAATGRKPSSTAAPKDKRAKTGRPKAPRASAQKDPKRAKLFCPKPGCTKRYMNPNGLKYHLEKGTCSFASAPEQ